MSNRQLEFLLILRDEATRVWNNVETRIASGAKRLGESFLSLQGIVAAFAGFQGLKMVMAAGAEATQSIDRLSSALKAAGVYSESTLKQMTAFSDRMMAVTVYDDEAVTSLQALLVSMTGMTGTAVEPLVKAALDLASALQLDVVSAGRMIAQSVNGRNILARYGIEVDKNASQTENLSKVVDQLAKKFGGFAENEARTTIGRLKQMAVQIDETKEKIGLMANDVMAKLSPAVLVITRAIGGAITISVTAIQVFISSALKAFFGMLVAIETATNFLGITNSRTMQSFYDTAHHQTIQYIQEYNRAVNEAFGLIKEDAQGAKSAIGTIVGGEDEGKMNKYAQRIAQLKEELQALLPASDEWVKKKKELVRLETILANLTEEGMLKVTGDVRISLFEKLWWGTNLADTQAKIRSEMSTFALSLKPEGTSVLVKTTNILGVTPDYATTTKEYYDAYKDAIDSISQMERIAYKDDKAYELRVVEEWLDKVENTYGVMESDITRAREIAVDRRAEIESRSFEKTFHAYIDEAKKGIGLIMQFSSQRYEAELDGISTMKEAELSRIDAALLNDRLSADQRKKLEKEKADITKKYDDEMRATKREQWEADRQGHLIMAIIDTAAAIVKALPNIPLAIIAGAMGAAQVAIIAAQATPKFRMGTGAAGFTVPAGFNNDNYPVLVSSGEKVRVTPRGGESGGATLIFNFNAPVSDEEFVYQSIIKRLRATGLPIDRTFRSSNTMVLGNR